MPMLLSPRGAARVVLTCLAASLAAPVFAQCAPNWQPGLGVPGTDGVVHVTHWWDPDGNGPIPGRLIAGGAFGAAGTVATPNIAAYDPATGTWSALGAGLGLVDPFDAIWALTTLPNGDLVAAGNFTTVGNRIAQWNGTAWSPLGGGLTGTASSRGEVRALAVMQNGDLVAGGAFTGRLSRWNGATWQTFTPALSGEVHALAVMQNGDLAVGGTFTFAGSLFVRQIARWNGSAWAGLGSGVLGVGTAVVDALLVLPNGDLVAGGSFTSIDGIGASGLAQWNGTQWSPLGTSSGTWPKSLALAANGDLVVGGYLSFGATYTRSARWNGASWTSFQTNQQGSVETVAVAPSGDVYVGGSIQRAGGVGFSNVARWNGSSWSRLGGGGFDAAITTLAVRHDGSVVAGGLFQVAGTSIAIGLAQQRAGVWSAIPGSPASASVFHVCEAPDDTLLVAGRFAPTDMLTRWNGTQWTPLAGGDGNGHVVAVADNGDLLLGGRFTTVNGVPANAIARYDGQQWTPLGSGLDSASAICTAIAPLPGGALVAGGFFATAGGAPANSVAVWNGNAWSALGAGAPGAIASLIVLSDGTVVAAGNVSGASGSTGFVQSWNGTQWSNLGSTNTPATVDSLLALPDGGFLVGGAFTTISGVAAADIARWSPATGTFAPIGAGLAAANPFRGVESLARRADGDVLVGGGFTTAGGASSAFFAELAAPCPAGASTYAAGCSGSAGPIALTVIERAFVGATCRTATTGFATGSVGVAVIGFTPTAIPLATLHPAGGPGCTLAATLDWTEALLPTAGLATWQLAIPNDPGLVGASIRHQMLVGELVGPNLTGFFSSNAVLLTFGAF